MGNVENIMMLWQIQLGRFTLFDLGVVPRRRVLNKNGNSLTAFACDAAGQGDEHIQRLPVTFITICLFAASRLSNKRRCQLKTSLKIAMRMVQSINALLRAMKSLKS